VRLKTCGFAEKTHSFSDRDTQFCPLCLSVSLFSIPRACRGFSIRLNPWSCYLPVAAVSTFASREGVIDACWKPSPIQSIMLTRNVVPSSLMADARQLHAQVAPHTSRTLSRNRQDINESRPSFRSLQGKLSVQLMISLKTRQRQQAYASQ
jgi:hypothetical protein